MLSGNEVTRLSISGTPGIPYGDFAGKTEQAIQPPTSGQTTTVTGSVSGTIFGPNTTTVYG